MHSKKWETRRIRFVLFLLVFGAGGCGTFNTNTCSIGNAITVPASDATPPTTSGMDIFVPNQPKFTVSPTAGPFTVAVGGDDKIALVAGGEDPQGIQNVKIWLDEIWYTAPGSTQVGINHIIAQNPHKTSVGDDGCSARLTTFTLDIKQRREIESAIGYDAVLTSEAVNFGGGTVKSKYMKLEWNRHP
ncbi:MAG: hypothetical protein MRJ68_06315 [Nitrospira sp.]|nr:hypothetical protein [Nitrospira sp.]